MSDDNLDINSALIARQVASGLSATTRLIQSLAADVRENSIAVATVKTEINTLKDDVRTISEILLREEKGTKPVLTRLALLEQLSEDIEKTIDKIETTSVEIKTKMHTLTNSLEGKKIAAQDKRDSRKHRWQLFIALITSIGALVAALLSALYA